MDYQFSSRISGVTPSAIREIFKFTADPSVISFAAGNPSAEAFPIKEIQELSAEIFSQNPVGALQYSISEGYPALRQKLIKRLREKNNIGRETDDLIIVSGAQQGIELSCKCLCNEGDTIICEAPSFIGSLNAFRSYGIKLCGIPMEEDGMNIELLEKALKEGTNIKAIYVIPTFQNPSGITTSFEKRKAIYALAKKYSVMIIEDNPYSDLRFAGEDIPTIKSFDEDGLVIYCGSFSKVLSAGMRVGYVSAPAPVISKLTVAKQVSDVHTNIFSQMLADLFIERYGLDSHIKRIKEVYRRKCTLMLDSIAKNFHPSVKYTKPQGGLFIWCTLPDGIDMMDFCRKAVQKKVAVVPGNAFLTNESDPCSSFRLNFSAPSDEQIVKGIEILGELTKEIII
jgi:2-aminoadipate transaminase